jgi:hypothetical protein
MYEYILPIFPQPFSFLPLGSLYRCDHVLLSVTSSEKGVDVAFFSSKDQGVTWLPEEEKWDWNWKKESDKYYFGRSIRADNNEKVRVVLDNNLYC